MRALLLTLLLLPLGRPAPAQQELPDAEETAPIRRTLAGLRLGDGMRAVRRALPPASEWPSTDEVRSDVTRYRVVRALAKSFPARVDVLYLGFRKGRLIEIEAVYDQEKSRSSPVEKLADEYALVYGEPKRSEDRFWWTDGRTVLRFFPVEVSLPKGGASAAWRTAVQLFERGLVDRGD